MYKPIFCISLISLLYFPLHAQFDNSIAFIAPEENETLVDVPDRERSEHLTKVYATLTFPGGQQGLVNFISKNLVYPEFAIENGIEGVVLAEAWFDEKGHLINASIKRSLMKACDEAVLDVLDKMPRWYPAILNGKPVSKSLLLPVAFKLQ